MNWFNSFWCFLYNNHQQITLILSVVTLLLATYGLNNWRKQINGTNRIKLAKKLLSQIYFIRDLFIHSRGIDINYKTPIDKNLTKYEIEKMQLEKRLHPIFEALVKFEKDYYEAYVEWGLQNSKHLQDLKRLYFKYIQAIDMYLLFFDEPMSSEKLEAYKIVFENSQNDEFMDKLNQIVNEFDAWLRPNYQCTIKRFYTKMRGKE